MAETNNVQERSLSDSCEDVDPTMKLSMTSPASSPAMTHTSEKMTNVTDSSSGANFSAGKPIPASLQKRISKTKICIHNLSGRCTRGGSCSFAHSSLELKEPPDLYKTRLCERWVCTGCCSKGESCRFAHGDSELRSTPEFFKTSLCPYFQAGAACAAGDKCRWAHGLHEIRQRGSSLDAPNQTELGPAAPIAPPTATACLNMSSSQQFCKSPTSGNLSTTTGSPRANSNLIIGSPTRPSPPPPVSDIIAASSKLGAIPPPPPPPPPSPWAPALSASSSGLTPERLQLERERLQLLTEKYKVELEKERLSRERALNKELRRQLEAQNQLIGYSPSVAVSSVAPEIELNLPNSDEVANHWAAIVEGQSPARLRAHTVSNLPIKSPSQDSRFYKETKSVDISSALDSPECSGVDASQVAGLLEAILQNRQGHFEFPSFHQNFRPTDSGLDSLEWGLSHLLQHESESNEEVTNQRRPSAFKSSGESYVEAPSRSSVSLHLPTVTSRDDDWSTGDTNVRKPLRRPFLEASSSISTTADTGEVMQGYQKGSPMSFCSASITSDDAASSGILNTTDPLHSDHLLDTHSRQHLERCRARLGSSSSVASLSTSPTKSLMTNDYPSTEATYSPKPILSLDNCSSLIDFQQTGSQFLLCPTEPVPQPKQYRGMTGSLENATVPKDSFLSAVFGADIHNVLKTVFNE